MLNLEGEQAGLSWETILNWRENYRDAFHDWNAERIAYYDDNQSGAPMNDAGIVRNRLKILAAVDKAKAYLRLREDVGVLDAWLWGWIWAG